MGGLGALNRVYLNIGLFSEEWLLHFNALVGGKPTTPIEIEVAQEELHLLAGDRTANSGHGVVLPRRAPDAHKLKDAPSGAAQLSNDQGKLRHGKEVFADRCARCHSSKLPPLAGGLRSRRLLRARTT